MRKLPVLLDLAFYSVSAWFLSAGILRYFRVPLALSLLCATLIALAVGGICALLLFSRGKKRYLDKTQKENKEKLMLHLALERDERIKKLLEHAYALDGKQAEAGEDAVKVDGENIVPLFRMQPLTADAVAAILRKFGEEPFVLACNELTPEAEKLLLSFGRTAVTGDAVFDLFERTGATPEKLICGEIPRVKGRAKLRRAFSKKNARPFFTGGILLLFMSLFTVFPIYYLISGCILLSSAVCVRILGYA